MSSFENWKTKPYEVLQQIFGENRDWSHETFVSQVEDCCIQRLNGGLISEIPSLNHTSVDHIPAGSLVHYRCMVQDVFDPQFCLGQYVVKNTQTQESRVECGFYRDLQNVSPGEIIDMDDKGNKLIERLGFYCVPIPGEADWVKQIYNEKYGNPPISSPSSGYFKRKIIDESTAEVKGNFAWNTEPPLDQSGKGNAKRLRSCTAQLEFGQDSSKTSVTGFARNFPLPNETGTPCIVRVYSGKMEIRTTDVLEVVGILSIDPALSSLAEEAEGIEEMDIQTHEPPTSMVPRIHALTVQKLYHNNPYLPFHGGSELYKSEVKKVMQDVYSIRRELHSIFQYALFGDSLAADYIICHLLARIYARADEMPLGKFCLNLSGCPNTQNYPVFLNHLISQLTCKSIFMEMTIDNMNSWHLVPKKDYTTNRVLAGMLQLPTGTQVVLDETALQQGQLDNLGVLNARALEHMITRQVVEYDFQWSTVPIQCDISVLILSEYTSFLSKDFHVPMVTESVTDIPTYFTLLDNRLNAEVLSKFRSYITACEQMAYEVSEDFQKVIQDDFVEIRQINPAEMSINDFHRLLTLLRLLTVSYGQETPNMELWRKAKVMENERKARLAKLPKPSIGKA